MKRTSITLSVVAALMVAAPLRAQTYNDSVRTRTWSVYGYGGVSSFHGMERVPLDLPRKELAPDVGIGLAYNIRPWVRLSLNGSFTQLKDGGRGILSQQSAGTATVDGKQIATTLQADRLQRRMTQQLLDVDVMAEFNVMQCWPRRKAQWLNLYLGVGAGWLHGWNRNTETWSMHEQGTDQGADHNNAYVHNFVQSTDVEENYNAFVVPATLSLEFDVSRQLTLGLRGLYRYVPTNNVLAPDGTFGGGLVVRYNFVRSKSSLLRKQIYALYADLNAAHEDCEKTVAELKAKYDEDTQALLKEGQDLRAETERAKREVAEMIKSITGRSTRVLFDNASAEITPDGREILTRVAQQLKDNPDRELMLIASASKTGKARQNKRLSDARLKAVREFLLDQGVTKKALKSQLSLGDRGMSASPDNRRVIIDIMQQK